MRVTSTSTIALSLSLSITLTSAAHAERYDSAGSFTVGGGLGVGDAPDATGGAELTGAGTFLGFGLYGSLEWRTGERLLDDGDTERRHGLGVAGGARLSPMWLIFASKSYDGPPPFIDLFAIAGGTFGWELNAGGFYGGGILGAGLDLKMPREHAPMIGVRVQRGYGSRADHLLGDTFLIVVGVVDQKPGNGLASLGAAD